MSTGMAELAQGSSAEGARRALAFIAASTFLSMSVWFSASFVVTQLREEWDVGSGEASLLTIAVQLGFVLGAISSAVTGVADTVPARRLMSIGALGAAVANAGLLVCDSLGPALVARLLTGACLALVYPPALKEVSSWFRTGRGTALSVMIAALTLGSALPHLVSATVALDWRMVIAVTSAAAALAALVMLAVRHSGPFMVPNSRVALREGLRSLRLRPVLLANVGYVGHMWELYAMWGLIGPFLASLPAVAGASHPETVAALLAFASIGIGALGCCVGGVISDRVGRTEAAGISLVCSGGAALVLSVVRGAPIGLVVTVCLFWGFWVIADSAQFSALVTEHAPAAYVGSAVAVQLALGYLTTIVTLWAVPLVIDSANWSVGLLVLAVGPVLGVAAMIALRRETPAN